MFGDDHEIQNSLPVNNHRIVGLLKAPKFIAQQWMSQTPNTVVGVILPSASTTRDANSMGGTLGITRGAGGGEMNEQTVVVSSESIASHMAQSRSIRSSSAQLNTASQLSVASQLNALRNIRTLKTKSAAIDRLYLMTRRVPNLDEATEDLPPTVRDGVPSVRGLFTGIDDATSRHPSTQSAISISRGLTVEAKIFGTMTLMPSLDNTYHTLLRSRHQQTMQSGRMTKESRHHPKIDSDDHASRLFRFYQPGTGFGNVAGQ